MTKEELYTKFFECDQHILESAGEVVPGDVLGIWELLAKQGYIQNENELMLALRGSDRVWGEEWKGKYVLFHNGVAVYSIPVMKLLLSVEEETFFRINEVELLRLFEVMLRAEVQVSDHCDYETHVAIGLPV